MTKEDLKKLIQEVYKEVASEPKAEKAKAEKPKSAPAAEKPAVKKVAKVAKAAAPKAEDPSRITKSFVKTIDTHSDKNKFAGDKGDADLFGKIKKILTPYVGRRLEESDLDKVMEDMQCDECYEEGAKPDFLDLDKDGNKKEPMKKAAMDAKTSKKLKEIIEKAKNI
jgi:predicted lipid-binding transport protein (Tim44 family)